MGWVGMRVVGWGGVGTASVRDRGWGKCRLHAHGVVLCGRGGTVIVSSKGKGRGGAGLSKGSSRVG